MKNQDRDFQIYRSRRLLGARSSEWYQNEAVFLYFHLVSSVFKHTNSTFCHFENHVRVASKIQAFSVGHELIRGENVGNMIKILIKIKIPGYIFRYAL